MGNSLMVACAKMGMHFTACTDSRYFPEEDLVKTCREIAAETGGSVTLTDSVEKGVSGVDHREERALVMPGQGTNHISPF